jgi:Trk K+ transport system NAD-binding subunit
VAVDIADNSQITGRTIAEVFERFPQLLAVAIIRDQRIELPRGSTALESGDQLLVVGSETKSIETFTRVATNRS